VTSVSSPLGRSPSEEWRRFENINFVSSPSPRPEGVCDDDDDDVYWYLIQ
jgi:hypothetical protein